MKNDSISRQAAIDAIRASAKKYTGFMEMEMYTDDDAVEAIEGLPSVQQWIPVAERLPENFESVLCWYEYYHWSKGKTLPEYGIGYVINGRWGGEVMNGKNCKVLAWMPLPEPYKGGKDEYGSVN